MKRIFISYNRVDKNRVFEIKNLIESQIGQEECWIDLEGIESDAQFKNVIISAINNCEVVLFMYSPTSAMNGRHEWRPVRLPPDGTPTDKIIITTKNYDYDRKEVYTEAC